MKYERFTPSEVVLQNMIEIKLTDGAEEGFRKVKETLQRMGIPSKVDNVLYQTAHILHKKGQYYICHFKELYALDGREADLSEADVARRNLIASYLMDWGLVDTLKPLDYYGPKGTPRMLKVIKHSEKDNWELSPKYRIGGKGRYVEKSW